MIGPKRKKPVPWGKGAGLSSMSLDSLQPIAGGSGGEGPTIENQDRILSQMFRSAIKNPARASRGGRLAICLPILCSDVPTQSPLPGEAAGLCHAYSHAGCRTLGRGGCAIPQPLLELRTFSDVPFAPEKASQGPRRYRARSSASLCPCDDHVEARPGKCSS